MTISSGSESSTSYIADDTLSDDNLEIGSYLLDDDGDDVDNDDGDDVDNDDGDDVDDDDDDDDVDDDDDDVDDDDGLFDGGDLDYGSVVEASLVCTVHFLWLRAWCCRLLDDVCT